MNLKDFELYKNGGNELLLIKWDEYEMLAIDFQGSLSKSLNKFAHAFTLEGANIDRVRETYTLIKLHNGFHRYMPHIIEALFDFGDRQL